MNRIFRISALAAVFLLLTLWSCHSHGENCVQRVADFERIDSHARSLFGSTWRTYLPMAHSPVVTYKATNLASKPKYPEINVQLNAQGMIEVKVGKDTYTGQLCETDGGLRLEVLVLGGLIVGDSVDIRPTSQPGEIMVVKKQDRTNNNNGDYNWDQAAAPQQWRYSVQDISSAYARTNTPTRDHVAQ